LNSAYSSSPFCLGSTALKCHGHHDLKPFQIWQRMDQPAADDTDCNCYLTKLILASMSGRSFSNHRDQTLAYRTAT
jgi:hypothetical protein